MPKKPRRLRSDLPAPELSDDELISFELIEKDPNWEDKKICLGLPLEELDIIINSKVSEKTRDMCFRCPVQMDCFTTAIVYSEPILIWGGLSHLERNRWTKLQKTV